MFALRENKLLMGAILALTLVACGARHPGDTPRRVGGCWSRGCLPGSFCDRQTGFCSVQACGNGCPPGTSCNRGLDRCEGPPPAPSDYSPMNGWPEPDELQTGPYSAP